MCGLILVAGPAPVEFPRALAALAARGPDARTILAHGAATFGHARLAVIDPAGGAQPMQSADGRYALAYNGEIYNYRALREELRAAGRSFATASDTEVLLAGYEHWGEGVLGRLDGMFAFALHDRYTGSVLLARDRLGIKPLFWAERGGRLWAASTLAPFFALEDFPQRLDPEGLRDYLAFQAPLSPRTLLAGVQSLPPACALRWEPGGGARLLRWWEPPLPAAGAASTAQLVEEFDELLGAAVAEELVADVPVGAFLSGGVDSSLLVHYMARAGIRPLTVFSVRFAEAGYDESQAARAVAERYRAQHLLVEAPAIDAGMLSAALADLDQPLADPAYVPTWALARLARAHVTVALSGDGADELFAGYGRFARPARDHPDSGLKRFARRLLRAGLLPGSLTRRALAGRELLLYRRVQLGDYPRSRKDLRRFLDPQLAAACRPERTLELWRALAERYGDYGRGALMRADLWTYLSENCLVKTDRASMAHGLEVRVPYLATRVLERVLRLPASAHFEGDLGKAILRALAQRHLPRAVWDRPKHGFSVPLRAKLAGPWREWAAALLADAPRLAPWLDARRLAALARAAARGRGEVRLLYTFLVLLQWLRTHPLSP